MAVGSADLHVREVFLESMLLRYYRVPTSLENMRFVWVVEYCTKATSSILSILRMLKNIPYFSNVLARENVLIRSN